MKKIIVAFAACSLGIAAQAQLIDDFSVNDLANYNSTIVLAQNASPTATLGLSGGTLQVSQTAQSGSGALQEVYLRNDGWSLGIGQMLRADVVGAVTNSVYSDFGIALMYSASPNAAQPWVSGTLDVRTNMVDVYVKGQTGAIGYSFRNAVNGNAGSSSGVGPVGTLAAVTGLWINHPSSGVYSVGYVSGGADRTLTTVTGLSDSIANALGFYSDLRANTTYGYLDNLRIDVPEPSTLALCGVGGFLGLMGWMRRRNG